jgi:hypothetical protein
MNYCYFIYSARFVSASGEQPARPARIHKTYMIAYSPLACPRTSARPSLN